MGNVWAEVCEAKVPNAAPEVVDMPDHPGASRVPYALMQGYYGSVCKIVRGGENFGTGWLVKLADLNPAIAKTLQDQNEQGIVTAKMCIGTKESAASFEALFDYVDDSAPGFRCPLAPRKFFYSGGGKSEYVIVGLRDIQEARRPMKLGLDLTDAQLPPQATITVVSHPQGLPREVSHGHITRVDETSIYYNAGAKAAMGSAVFFAHQKDLHVIAMGLKSAGTDIHEVQGVRVSRFKEVFYDEGFTGEEKKAPSAPSKAGAAPAESAGPPQDVGPARIIDVKDMKIKLANGQQVTYSGQLKAPANVPHGTGTAVYDHGVTYEGEWDVGKRHGPGKITKEKEGYYSKGECEDDLFIGTWTKYKTGDDTVLEEQHYDHTTMDTVRRHLGMASRKARPKEESPTKDKPAEVVAASPAKK